MLRRHFRRRYPQLSLQRPSGSSEAPLQDGRQASAAQTADPPDQGGGLLRLLPPSSGRRRRQGSSQEGRR